MGFHGEVTLNSGCVEQVMDWTVVRGLAGRDEGQGYSGQQNQPGAAISWGCHNNVHTTNWVA